ncbi:MAG TPA: outer membrane beta-barrel protein [Bryobacteraceae bacterium]|nr:outer membrane beta-barrel protein [Bryobacteraceae bacterium]
MRTAIPFLCVTMLSTLAFGQRPFSVGIKGGVPWTDAFSDTTTHGVDTITHAFSDSKKFVIGPMVELNLPLGVSIEADALYRPLNLTTMNTVLPRPPLTFVNDISSWEFPILGKYHFLHLPLVKPYAEAGPIFRHVGSDASYLSKKGFALGAGVDFKLLLLKLTPEIRYSRWGSDATASPVFNIVPSKQNQAEFLIGLSF